MCNGILLSLPETTGSPFRLRFSTTAAARSTFPIGAQDFGACVAVGCGEIHLVVWCERVNVMKNQITNMWIGLFGWSKFNWLIFSLVAWDYECLNIFWMTGWRVSNNSTDCTTIMYYESVAFWLVWNFRRDQICRPVDRPNIAYFLQPTDWLTGFCEIFLGTQPSESSPSTPLRRFQDFRRTILLPSLTPLRPQMAQRYRFHGDF